MINQATMLTALYLLIGLIAVLPLLAVSHAMRFDVCVKLLGRCLILAALVYLGFAIVWGNAQWWGIELAGAGFYALFYYLAVKQSPLWLAAGWGFHPMWDLNLHLFGPGVHIVPQWYAWACVSFDTAVAGYLAWRIVKENFQPNPPN